MDLPVIIMPLPDHGGFSARLVAPIDLCAEGPTADEAQERLAALLHEKMRDGFEVRTLHVGPRIPIPPGGWLPNDELTEEWRQHMKAYRDQCDAEDRARILGVGDDGEPLP